jgi:hypothetical protein
LPLVANPYRRCFPGISKPNRDFELIVERWFLRKNDAIYYDPGPFIQSCFRLSNLKHLLSLRSAGLDTFFGHLLGQVHRAREPIYISNDASDLLVRMIAALDCQPNLKGSGPGIEQCAKGDEDASKNKGFIVKRRHFPSLPDIHCLWFPLACAAWAIGAFIGTSAFMLNLYFPPNLSLKFFVAEACWGLLAVLCAGGFYGTFLLGVH